MTNLNIIDITQDGSGIILNDSELDGFITGFVETCCIYIAYGDIGFCLIHDTGQLDINSITDVIEKCGSISELFYAINPNKIYDKQMADHDTRRAAIASIINTPTIHRVFIPDETIIALKGGRVLSNVAEMLNLPANLAIMPDKELRRIINNLNNLFSPKNSQSIPVDFQFDGEFYTDLPQLLKTPEQMRAIGLQKQQQGDPDYINYFNSIRHIFGN